MSESACSKAVHLNYSGTQVDLTYEQFFLSGTLCERISVDFQLVDTCTQYKDCDGSTLVKLGVFPKHAGV